jgi:hypothetical protein
LQRDLLGPEHEALPFRHLAAQRSGEHLVPKARAEQLRVPSRDDCTDQLHRVLHPRRAWAGAWRDR